MKIFNYDPNWVDDYLYMMEQTFLFIYFLIPEMMEDL